MQAFYRLESDCLSKNERQDLLNQITGAGILLEQKFDSYLRYRLSNKMTMTSFENLARNIYNHHDLSMPLKTLFADFMAQAYLKQAFAEYFQHIVKFDRKRFAIESLYSPELDIVMSIAERVIHHASYNYSIDESISWMRGLAIDTSLKWHYLLCKLGDQFYSRGDKSRLIIMIDRLSPADRFELLGTALYAQTKEVFREVEQSLAEDSFFDYAKKNISDDSLLCKTIRGPTINHPEIGCLQGKSTLFKVFIESPERVPQTLEHILELATKCKFFDTVIKLGACFPKRRILEIILQENNEQLTDKFFFLYKDYPEIKNLTPFV